MAIGAVKKEFIVPDNIRGSHVKAFFTTRQGGNYLTSFLRESGFSSIFMPRQKHTDHVYVLQEKEKSVIADAVITKRKNILIGVSAADCVPVIFTNEAQDVAGVIHAGWRGTAGALTKKTLEVLIKYCHIEPEHIIMAIGPSIGQCCYEVGSEVAEKVTAVTGEGDYVFFKNNALFLNLKEANRIQALSQGVKSHNIWMSSSCTCCESDRFFSYRCEGKTAQRQGGFIGLTGGDKL
jgi:YfiH family protein